MLQWLHSNRALGLRIASLTIQFLTAKEAAAAAAEA